ncbi:U-box-domain-containing protein [Martensiomyces pterosporus]|nr:U-box-domain-containing protein [Martensiomyces pterosporus]
MASVNGSTSDVELLDYADSRLGTQISCDYPSTTNFEIENLIAEHRHSTSQHLLHSLAAASRGFMAESFVKPPVELILAFPYELSLAAIALNPRVRMHTAKVITVYVEGGWERWEMAGRMIWPDPEDARPLAMCNKELNPQIVQNAASRCPGSICSSMRAGSWMPIEKPPGVLHSVRRVKLRISSMHGAHILGLGGVEIWAQPSRRLPQQQRAQIWSTAQKMLRQDSKAGEDPVPASSSSAASCPPEFVDVITQSIMRDPVVLPSKAICDRSTIVRHLQNHKTDPFTGLPLNYDDVKPNLALQQRIRTWMETQPAAE